MSTEALPPLSQRLIDNPDGVLERIAEEYGVSTKDVVAALPALHQTMVAGDHFLEIMTELQSWGEVMVIVHTADIVLECAGAIPPGTVGRGYYNLHGDSPVGGHIKYESCSAIALVARPFMGRHSCSVQFFNAAGEAMFKVFVRRDKDRNLIPEQVAKFQALRERLTQKRAA